MNLTITNIRYGGYFKGMTVVSDAPVGLELDKLAFTRYLDPLTSVLTDSEQETPFTIGIFGPWGSGKSSLLRMIKERLSGGEYTGQYVCVDFNPWVHRKESNLLIPLLHSLRDELNKDKSNRFTESAQKLWDVLLRLGADALLNKLTMDAVSLKNIEELEKKYLERRHMVESEMRNLHATLQQQADAVYKKGASLVLLVDDLDRCQPDQIIDLLDSVKLFLDLKHVFVVLAVDREVVNSGIQVRYDKFKFAEGRDIVVGAQYLEKMIQLPVELFPLADTQIEELGTAILPGDENKMARDLIKNVALPNARKIKRLLNVYAVVRAFMLADETLKKLDTLIVLRLVALQVQFPEIYWGAAAVPKLLIGLEQTYRGTVNYQTFGPLMNTVKAFCERHHRPGSVLSRLFEAPGFSGIQEEQLAQYFSMLGGPVA